LRRRWPGGRRRSGTETAFVTSFIRATDRHVNGTWYGQPQTVLLASGIASPVGSPIAVSRRARAPRRRSVRKTNRSIAHRYWTPGSRPVEVRLPSSFSLQATSGCFLTGERKYNRSHPKGFRNVRRPS